MELYYLCSENKGTDQLRSYCAADLHLCSHICKKQVLIYSCIVSIVSSHNKVITVKFLNFKTPENFAVIYLKFEEKNPNLRVHVFSLKDANGIANSEDPDQTAP